MNLHEVATWNISLWALKKKDHEDEKFCGLIEMKQGIKGNKAMWFKNSLMLRHLIHFPTNFYE